MSIGTKIQLAFWELKNNPEEAIRNFCETIRSYLGKTVAAQEFEQNQEDEDNPTLSDEAYRRIEIYLGKSKANEVRAEVENRKRGKEEAEDWSKKLELIMERSEGRRTIEPEEWRDFEEGWRPDNW